MLSTIELLAKVLLWTTLFEMFESSIVTPCPLLRPRVVVDRPGQEDAGNREQGRGRWQRPKQAKIGSLCRKGGCPGLVRDF